jgi:hypothetical protein
MIRANSPSQNHHNNNETVKAKVKRLESENKQLQSLLEKQKTVSAQVVNVLKKQLQEKVSKAMIQNQHRVYAGPV